MSERAKARAVLAAIDEESGDAATRAWLKFRALYGVDVMSRRAFLQNALQIIDRKKGTFGPWWLNDSQRHTEMIRLRTVRAGKLERYATLKARKRGISTLWLGYGLERICRVPHFKGAIIANKTEDSQELLQTGKLMRANLPLPLKAKFDNKNELQFASPLGGSIIIGTARSKDPLRSKTMRLVHGTEPQLWDDAERKRAALELTVATEPGTVVSYEGTGCGRNWWYEFWFSAHHGRNNFVAIFLSWLRDKTWDFALELSPEQIVDLVESRTPQEEKLRSLGASWGQIVWRRRMIADSFSGNEKLFKQEYPSTPEEAFLAEGRPAFNTDNVLRAIEGCRDPLWHGDITVDEVLDPSARGVEFKLLDAEGGNLKIWKRPEQGREYALGADVGNGIDEDNSAACVLDLKTGEECASLVTGNVEPAPFGRLVAGLGRYYGNAYALVEIEGPGRATLLALRDVNYPMIGTRNIFDTRGRVVGEKLGWSTNSTSRPLLFNELREDLAGDSGIREKETCNEMLGMIRDEKDHETTQPGGKDDRVLARAIAGMARRQAYNGPPGGYGQGVDLEPGSLEEQHWSEFAEQVREREELRMGGDGEDQWN